MCGRSLRNRQSISGMTTRLLSRQHHAIFMTQTIPLSQSRREDTFPPALSAKHTPSHLA